MRRRSFLAGASAALVAGGARAATPPLLARFDAALDRQEMAGWMRRLTAEPNQVGAPHNLANARFIAAQFASWGWDTRIEALEVLCPAPTSARLELLVPRPFQAKLIEPAGATVPGVLGAFAAFGADGDVTAPLAYVNYGMAGDYATLARMGIEVAGKIVIARFGGGWRGVKVKLAEQHGALGVVLYSDPRDDGYFLGDVYPTGPMRPPGAIQRGSVVDLPSAAGDPTTPGAGPGARRLDHRAAPTVPKIPVLPIGYGDAEPLLAALGGPVAPEAWRGALPLTYHLGDGDTLARLAVRSDWRIQRAHNVIAKVRGASEPNLWVLRGNHRDAWVFGAWDPMSGTVAMMAEAKAIGGLLKSGWRPRRTLVYASWDAEEPGVFGSTEWVETHASELRRKAVLYVNSDANARGALTAEGSGSLEALVASATGQIADPETGGTVQDRMRAKAKIAGAPPLDPIGSGSDYAAFVHHLGIPALDLYFGGEGGEDAVYHSAYDTYDHHSRFGDPGFAYAETLAKTAGRIVLAAADDPLPPQRFAAFARAMTARLRQLQAMAESHADPSPPVRRSSSPGAPETPLDFTALAGTLARVSAAAAVYDNSMSSASALPLARLRRLNTLAREVDQALISEAGLPGRPWYRNLAYAPGLLTGYAAEVLPGLEDAITAGDWSQAQARIDVLVQAFEEYARRIDLARAVVTP